MPPARSLTPTKGKAMIRTPTLLLPGTLFTAAGCNSAVSGDPASRADSDDSARYEIFHNKIYSTSGFRNADNASTEVAARPTRRAEPEHPVSDRVITTSPRTESTVAPCAQPSAQSS